MNELYLTSLLGELYEASRRDPRSPDVVLCSAEAIDEARVQAGGITDAIVKVGLNPCHPDNPRLMRLLNEVLDINGPNLFTRPSQPQEWQWRRNLCFHIGNLANAMFQQREPVIQ